MNILFVTFGHLSVGAGAIRSVSMLRALGDAGHQVAVIAAHVSIVAHPNIRVLAGGDDKVCSPKKLRLCMLRALGRRKYQVVHAVDDAVIYLSRLGKLKRVRMVYEASRCFSGSNGVAPFWYWKHFPERGRRRERRILERADLVFTSCNELSADLRKLADHVPIVQVEDVPAQTLFSRRDVDRCALLEGFHEGISFLVVCSVLPGNRSELRTLLLAVRKVVDRIPRAGFFFKGVDPDEAKTMAANLEVQDRCVFLSPDVPERFLDALSIADAAMFIPQPGRKYLHPEILTLLNSPALVVAVHEGAYSGLLNDRNSLRVDYTASSIAEGLMRVVQEPLLAFGIVSDAQQMIADHYSFSSFKHKIRMAYHELVNRH